METIWAPNLVYVERKKESESEKCHEIRPLKMDTLTVSTFDAFIHVHDESKTLPQSLICTEEILLYTVHIKSVITKFFFFLVRGTEIFLGWTLCVLKCFVTSIRRQCSEELTLSFVENFTPVTVVRHCIRCQCFILPPNVWVVFKIYFAILHKIVAINKFNKVLD